MKTKWLAIFTILMMCLLSVYALADGDSEWLRSRFNNYIQLASHVGDYDGWLDISGLGGVTLRDGVSVRVISRNILQMRVWERGNGETKACGTGACAAVVAAVENGFCKRDTEITVQVPGGELIAKYKSDGTVTLSGNARLVFEGEIEI